MTVEHQYLVYNHYILEATNRDLKIGKSMNCPFPDAPEKNPSFTVFFNKAKDTLLWKLWNSGDTGNVYSFVARMEDKPVGLASQLIMELIVSESSSDKKEIGTKLKFARNTPSPNIEIRPTFTARELKYWNDEAGFDELDLIMLDIYSLKSLTYGDKKPMFQSTNSEPKFIYPFFDEDDRVCAWQMYNPKTLNKKNKWRSGGEVTVGNIQNMPNSAETVYWCTSKKDGGVLWKHVLNYKQPFIHSPKEMQTQVVIDLITNPKFSNKFPNVVYVPDIEWYGEKLVNGRMVESPGLVRAKKIEDEYNIPYLRIDYPAAAKDITDLYKLNRLDLIKL